MTERIKSLIAQLGLSTRNFAINCGLRQNTLSNQLNGVRELSLATVMAIINSYPELSLDWLMKGQGQMFKKTDDSLSSEAVLRVIAELQKSIEAQRETIKILTERNAQFETQLKIK